MRIPFHHYVFILHLSQLKRIWYLSQRRPANAQASMRIRTVSPEPSLFAHIKYEIKRRVRPKIETSSLTGWLRMRVWRIILWRTKSTIICILRWNDTAVFPTLMFLKQLAGKKLNIFWFSLLLRIKHTRGHWKIFLFEERGSLLYH